MCHISYVACHMSCVTCHQHQQPQLINKIRNLRKKPFDKKSPSHSNKSYTEGTHNNIIIYTEVATYRLNWPRGQFSKTTIYQRFFIIYVDFQCQEAMIMEQNQYQNQYQLHNAPLPDSLIWVQRYHGKRQKHLGPTWHSLVKHFFYIFFNHRTSKTKQNKN